MELNVQYSVMTKYMEFPYQLDYKHRSKSVNLLHNRIHAEHIKFKDNIK